MSIKKYSTDEVMLAIQQNLVTDLMSGMKRMILGGQPMATAVDFRKLVYKNYIQAPMDHFRRIYQCESFLKRYTFADDLYTPEYLEYKTKKDFLESQENFGVPEFVPTRIDPIVDHARAEVQRVLGNFDLSEFVTSCKWGKRAAKGLPARRAYLDLRVGNLTCTPNQEPWFQYFTMCDGLFRRMCVKPKVVDSVNYTTVPKSYKSLRGIAPDVSFGGFLSQGLGIVIRSRLEKGTPINLSTAKELHMKLARSGSINGSLATIDMSKASDSFVWDHIAMLVPEDWHEILDVVRVPHIELDGKKYSYKSYMLMGSGHTFPLQTLLFYSLAVGVMKHLDVKGTVRVFGDDIIVPTIIARHLISTLESLGFSINRNKSFVRGHFRESCGGDYYKGLDVRPAMPEGTSCYGSQRKYASLLFKTINSLRKRWSVHEIPQTVAYVYGCLASVCPNGIPKGIPGVHAEDSCLLYSLGNLPVVAPRITLRDGCYFATQRILVQKTGTRIISNELPYFWDALRAAASTSANYDFAYERQDIVNMHDFFWDKEWRPCVQSAKRIKNNQLIESRKGTKQQLIWKRVKRAFPQYAVNYSA